MCAGGPLGFARPSREPLRGLHAGDVLFVIKRETDPAETRTAVGGNLVMVTPAQWYVRFFLSTLIGADVAIGAGHAAHGHW